MLLFKLLRELHERLEDIEENQRNEEHHKNTAFGFKGFFHARIRVSMVNKMWEMTTSPSSRQTLKSQWRSYKKISQASAKRCVHAVDA